ncbi:MAG: hypothetical protein U1E65_00500 [Myxococcota bacterium]
MKDKFGGRQKLVEQLVSLVDKQNGDESAEATKSRLMGLSNAKLLRLYKVEQTVRERYGDRAKLVQSVVDARKKAGMSTDDGVKNKLASFTKARLLDLAKQKLGEKPAKQTPAEKMANKRGRKQRERAQSKLKG